MVAPMQGLHVVLVKSFLQGDYALMIPHNRDGRVLVAVPWHEFTRLCNTDTPLPSASLEPRALEKEVDFVLQTAGNYLTRMPSRSDILSVFAGLRTLAAPDKAASSTKEISRSHKLIVSDTGLIDRKSDVSGKRVSVRVELGGRSISKKQHKQSST